MDAFCFGDRFFIDFHYTISTKYSCLGYGYIIGIDLKFNGDQEVIGNFIDDCHTGIASMAGSQIIKNNTITNCGDGVYIDPKSSATAIDNTFVPAPEESQRVWRYGDYEIPVFDYPEL